MSVIFITERNLDVYLDHGRGGPDSWYFHVVLSFDDLIFDFDFKDSPEVVSRSTYFNTALRKLALEKWKTVSLRIIPATSYLENYNPENTADFGFCYWLLPERSHFPEKSVLEFILKN